MPDQNVKLKTDSREALDVATELTLALIEAGHIMTSEDAREAFQEIFNGAYYAYENKRNPVK